MIRCTRTNCVRAFMNLKNLTLLENRLTSICIYVCPKEVKLEITEELSWLEPKHATDAQGHQKT